MKTCCTLNLSASVVPPVRSAKLLPIQNQEINNKLYEDILIKMRDDEVRRAIKGDGL